MLTLAGLATARGMVAGPVFLYRGAGDIPVEEYRIEPGREAEEHLRLRRALRDTRRDVENLIASLKSRGEDIDTRIFDGHLMMLEDPSLLGDMEKLVIEQRLCAEAAVKRAIGRFRRQFEQMNDAYFRERISDLDDVERRLLRALTGFVSQKFDIRTPSILIADDLTPSETVQMPRELVLGFATNGGSTTSHVALLARAMGIPCVTGLADVTEKVRADSYVLLDGSQGTITVNPTEEAIRDFQALIHRQEDAAAALKDGRPAGALRDGGEVMIYANVHPGVPFGSLRDLGARGIGLYRSEYLWLNGEQEPDEETQFKAYREVAEYVKNLSPEAAVTIRALDIGGDKAVKGITKSELNPFLGNRSIRYLLSDKRVFKTQLRAILRASAYGRVKLMYPMVSCVDEMREAAVVMAEAKLSLDREGVAYDPKMPVGIMIEIPAAAINVKALVKYADFLSIGTNDLIQYTMAADRSNESVAHLYQPTNPAVLELMNRVITCARENHIPVSVCGESASDPIIGILWASFGTDILSMSATYIPVMARILRRLSRVDLNDYRDMALTYASSGTGTEILEACRRWMLSKIPDLEELTL